MSTFPPPTPHPYAAETPRSNGLAVAALVCGLVGFCVPGLGLVGVALGIVALTRASRDGSGQGMAVAGIATGAIFTVTSTLMVCGGIMLPALGQARQTARQLKSATQLRVIGGALGQYSVDNKGWFPEQGADLPSRLLTYGTDPVLFESPHAEGNPSVVSYFYLAPKGPNPPGRFIVAYENPAISRKGVNVLRADGSVEFVPKEEYEALNNELEQQGSPPMQLPPGL